MAHLKTLIDKRTKLVCCTGASNFLGAKPSLPALRSLAEGSGYLYSRAVSSAHICWSMARSWCPAM